MRSSFLALILVACGSSAKPTPLANAGSAAQPAQPLGTELSVKLFDSIGGRSIEGVVRDRVTKQPLDGAVIVAVSPALQGERVDIVDGNGRFALSDLPPGPYTLVAYFEDQVTSGTLEVQQGKVARVTLDWDFSQRKPPEEIVVNTGPPFTTALEALGHGAMELAVRLGRAELATKPSARLHAIVAFATYGFAIETLRFEGLGGSPLSPKHVKAVLARVVGELDQVKFHLTEAATDPTFALELCVACMAVQDAYFSVFGVNGLDVERDRTGNPLPEGDKRRRPTYRFDHGDLAWARAMINYQQALANIALAYDWEWFDNLDAMEGKQITIKLLEPARIAKAKELLLAGLVASDEARLAFLAETDDDREWVPNPKQTNYASPLAVDAALYKTWEAVVADVRTLVAGNTGISLAALWSLAGEQGAPTGFIDLGALLSTPKDIVFEVGAVDRIEIEKSAKKRAAQTTTFLKGVLGNGYKPRMKASPLTDRLIQLRKDRATDETAFEDKLKYVLWLN